MLARVAACSHMLTFMAGAITTGAVVATHGSSSSSVPFGSVLSSIVRGFMIQGFISTFDNAWATYNEIGFKGATLNTADLNLHLENNRQDFTISGSNAVLLRNVIMEGANTLGVASTIDGSRGV